MPGLDRSFTNSLLGSRSNGGLDTSHTHDVLTNSVYLANDDTYKKFRDGAWLDVQAPDSTIRNLDSVLKKNPGLSPSGGFVALATGLPSDSPLYQKLQQMDSEATAEKAKAATDAKAAAQQQADQDSGNWFTHAMTDVGHGFMFASRWGMAAAQFPVQAFVKNTTNYATSFLPGVSKGGQHFGSIFSDTDLGAAIAHPTDTGGGFFVNSKATNDYKAQANHDLTGDITYNNEATGGQSTTGSNFAVFAGMDPTSLPFRNLSGMIDGATYALDPTMWVGAGEVKAAVVGAKAGADALKGGEGIKDALTAGKTAAELSKDTKGTIIAKGMSQAKVVSDAQDALNTYKASEQTVAHTNELVNDLVAKGQMDRDTFAAIHEKLVNEGSGEIDKVTAVSQELNKNLAAIKAKTSMEAALMSADDLRQLGFENEKQFRSFAQHESLTQEKAQLLAEREQLAANAPGHTFTPEEQAAFDQAGAQAADQAHAEALAAGKTDEEAAAAADAAHQQAATAAQKTAARAARQAASRALKASDPEAYAAAQEAAKRLKAIDRRVGAIDDKAKMVLSTLPDKQAEIVKMAEQRAKMADLNVTDHVETLQQKIDAARAEHETNQAALREQIAKHEQDAEAARVVGQQVFDGFAKANEGSIPSLNTGEGIRAYLERTMGVFNSPDGSKLSDMDRALQTIMSGKASPIFEAFANINSKSLLWDLTRGRLDADLVSALADSKTAEEAKNVFVNALAKGELDANMGSLNALRSAYAKIGPVAADAAINEVYKQVGAKARFLRWSNDAARSLVPWAYDMHIEDRNAMINGLADMYRFVLKGKSKNYASMYHTYVNKMIEAETGSERAKVFYEALDALHEEAAAKAGIQEGSVAWESMKERFTASLAARNEAREFNADVRVVSKGKPSTVLGGIDFGDANIPMMESQLSDRVHMPNPRDMQKVFAKVKVLQQGTIGDAKSAIDSLFDKHWRTLVITGRYTYVLRNTAEMAVRMFLNNHMSFLTHPVAIFAMAMTGKSDGALGKLISHMDVADEDILGHTFTRQSPDLDSDLNGAVDEYQQIVQNENSALDPGSASDRYQQFGYKTVNRDQPGFARALAGSFMQFYADPIGRDVMRAAYDGRMGEHIARYAQAITDKDGNVLREAITDPREAVAGYYLDTPKGQAHLKNLAGSRDKLVQLLSTREGVMAYMFGDEPLSLEQRLLAHNGGTWSPEIMEPLLSGKFSKHSLGTGTPVPLSVAYERQKELGVLLQKQFGSRFKDASFPVERTQTPILAKNDSPASGFLSKLSWLNKMFFKHAAHMEKVFAKQPEFRFAYWDHVGDLVAALNKSDAQEILAQAREALPRKYRWSRQTYAKIERNVKHATGNGNITVEDIHGIAMDKASTHVNKLFYNAMARNQTAHALRLVSPFAQAWGNTLRKWGELAIKNPRQVYKADFLYKKASEPGSSVIYEDLGEDPIDGAGFLYKDPVTGQVKFTMPLYGKGMGALGYVLNFGRSPYMPTRVDTPLSSWNLAFNGSVLPGLGPVMQVPFAAIDKYATYQKIMPDYFKNWVAPVTDSTAPVDQGLLERFTPALPKAVLGFFGTPGYQYTTARYLKPIMTELYSMNPGDYTDPTTGAIDQDLLVSRATDMAGSYALSRALFQQVAGGSITPEAMLKVGGTQWALQSTVTKELSDTAKQLGDYNEALGQMMDKYGTNNVLAFVTAKNGANYANGRAWQFTKDNMESASAYPDVVPLLFADGDYNAAYQRYLNETGKSGKAKTPEESIQAANSILEAAQKSAVNAKLVAGTITSDQASDMLSAINQDFGGTTGTPDLYKRPKAIAELKDALANSDAIAGTQAGQAASQYMALRDVALGKIEAATGKVNEQNPFQSNATAQMRDFLYAQGEQLAQQYPDFRLLWTRTLKSEVAP